MIEDLLDRFLASANQIALLDVRRDGSILAVNPAFAAFVQAPGEQLLDAAVEGFLTAGQVQRVEQWLSGSRLPDAPVLINFAAVDGTPFTLRCLVERSSDGLRLLGETEAELDRPAADELMKLNNELAVMARERARRERELERIRDELEEALEDLRTSYWHLQKIQEVLPICMGCGKIKTSGAQWATVADYLRENEIFLSHGYCPQCASDYETRHGLE